MKTKLFFAFLFSSCFSLAQSTLPGRAILSTTNLNEGLVNYYPFSGNANDESGYNHNGILYGATLANDRFNNPNSCYRFSGNQYIQFPIDSTQWTSYTIMGWTFIQYGEENTSFNRHILSVGTLPEGVGLIQYPPTGLKYRQGIYYDQNIPTNEFSQLQGFSHGATYAANLWRHYALTVDTAGATHTLSDYLNGSYIAGSSMPSSAIQLNSKIGNIGCRIDNKYYFNGYVDDIRIYKRALSACEIGAIYGAHYCVDSVCANTSSIYYAQSDGATSYQWNVSPSTAAASLTPMGDSCIVYWSSSWTGIAKVITQGKNSIGSGPADSISVVVTPGAPSPIVSISGDTLYSSIASGNQWYFNSSPIAGATGQTYILTQTGNYFTVITGECGSDTSNITYPLNPDQPGNINWFSISPNPSSGHFYMESQEKMSSYEIVNLLGEKICSSQPNSTQAEIDLSKEAAGIYLLQVKILTEVSISKIIKQLFLD